jgi:hypothetical protein
VHMAVFMSILRSFGLSEFTKLSSKFHA